MSEVKAISFGFENCETAYIPINYVYTFNIGEVTKSKSYYPHGQGVREYTVGNKLYVQFTKSFYDFTDKTTCDELVIERLKKWNDICWFTIHYEDGSQEDYQITWKYTEDADPYSNEGQKVEDTDLGLTIEVGYE